MKKSTSCLGVLAVALMTASPLAAQQKAQAPAKSPSPFLLCDGRTGHVGLGEALGRLVAITVTAGLSEVATRQDDVDKRLDGVTAAAACETAIQQEGNELRRVELEMARAVHLIEADRLDDALIAIRTIPSLAGSLATDPGYQRTLKPRVDLIEADILVRLRRSAEAQEVAVRATEADPYDVALAQKAARFMRLTAKLDDRRNQALGRLHRIMPELVGVHLSALIGAERQTDAEGLLAAIPAAYTPFMREPRNEYWLAYRALVLALDGRTAEARTLADGVRHTLADLAPSGYAVRNADVSAAIGETLALTDVVLDAQAGRGQKARATFTAHGPWLLVEPLTVPLAVERLRRGAPKDELSGDLAQTPTALRDRFFDQATAALADKSRIKPLYSLSALYAKSGAFRGASGTVWKIGTKPKLLMKPDKEQLAGTDFINASGRAYGIAASDVLTLHAALIAQSRGYDRVMFKPGREYLEFALVRFGKSGQPDMPDALTLDVGKTIADLSQVIPEPLPRS